MKKVCKKLLSLMLVAVLLATAIPFQALAAEGHTLTLKLRVNDENGNEIAAPEFDLEGIVDVNLDWSTINCATHDYTADEYEILQWHSGTLDLKGQSSVTLDQDAAIAVRIQKKAVDEGTDEGEEVPPTEEVVVPKTRLVVKIDSSDNNVRDISRAPANGESSTVRDMLNNWWMDGWEDKYTLDHVTLGGNGNITLDTAVAAGSTVYVMMNTKSADSGSSDDDVETKTIKFINGSTTIQKTYEIGEKMDLPEGTAMSGYTFKGWYTDTNGKGTKLTNGTVCTNKLEDTYYAYYTKNVKFDYDVYLNIYVDNKVDEPAKRLKITDGIAKDGTVTMGEVEDVVFDYYTSKSSKGIVFDGLYMATGDWVDRFNRDDKEESYYVGDAKESSNVFINVMITNAKAKSSSSSSTSDSTNYKTGDDIYMTVTVMGLSLAALAGVYYISKKRAVR